MAEQANANPVALARLELGKMESEFSRALPAHIPVERFTRVVMTAIQNNPDLVIKCDRRSLWNAAMRAAQDGLLPDGRDGAIVEYKGVAQWMPMIGGIRKKVRNSGEIATWDVQAVYENDNFEFELGDDPFIRHKPSLGERGKIIAVYSIATLKSGEKSRDVMGIEEVEKIRKISRAQNGPWANPTFYPEMAKKTVARRHSKVLPMSSDLDDLIRRDDNLYDLAGAADATVKPQGRGIGGKLAALAGPPLDTGGDVIEQNGETFDGETGEQVSGDQTQTDNKPAEGDAGGTKGAGKGKAAIKPKDGDKAAGQAAQQDGGGNDQGQGDTGGGNDGAPGSFEAEEIEAARERGAEAKRKGMGRKTLPPEWRGEGWEPLADAWVDGWTNADAPE